MNGWTKTELYAAEPEDIECIIEMMQEEADEAEQQRLQHAGM